MTIWRIFDGSGKPHDHIDGLPEPPPWRRFDGELEEGVELPAWRKVDVERASSYRVHHKLVDLVNAAILLRRPLLVTGRPGVGKSSLAYAIAHELKLGPVLRWPITSRSNLKEGLYSYDAISRLHDVNLGRAKVLRLRPNGGAGQAVGRYLTLGPLGTALLPHRRPRVLLVDEIDKSDIDLPSDLLNVLEDGQYEVPELVRTPHSPMGVYTADGIGTRQVARGKVQCSAFPIIIMTSNREREFPPAFLRRCIPATIPAPTTHELKNIVEARMDTGEDMAATAELDRAVKNLMARFATPRAQEQPTTDHLLAAVYLRLNAARDGKELDDLATVFMRHFEYEDEAEAD
jgi:MoxR-like ATPase